MVDLRMSIDRALQKLESSRRMFRDRIEFVQAQAKDGHHHARLNAANREDYQRVCREMGVTPDEDGYARWKAVSARLEGRRIPVAIGEEPYGYY